MLTIAGRFCNIASILSKTFSDSLRKTSRALELSRTWSGLDTPSVPELVVAEFATHANARCVSEQPSSSKYKVSCVSTLRTTQIAGRERRKPREKNIPDSANLDGALILRGFLTPSSLVGLLIAFLKVA